MTDRIKDWLILNNVFGIRFRPVKAAQDNMLDKGTRTSASLSGEYPLGRHRLMGLLQYHGINLRMQNFSICT